MPWRQPTLITWKELCVEDEEASEGGYRVYSQRAELGGASDKLSAGRCGKSGNGAVWSSP